MSEDKVIIDGMSVYNSPSFMDLYKPWEAFIKRGEVLFSARGNTKEEAVNAVKCKMRDEQKAIKQEIEKLNRKLKELDKYFSEYK